MSSLENPPVILYFRKSDYEIDSITSKVSEVCSRFGFKLLTIDIEALEKQSDFQSRITPSLKVGPYLLKYPFSLDDVEIALNAYASRGQNEARENLRGIRSKNIFGLFLANFYPLIIAMILFLFVGGAFLAPIYARSGSNAASTRLYSFYSVFCHQFAFRSFFLFGEQAFYPRELAKISGLTTYEEEFQDDVVDINIAREIIGNSESGFKIALCERDLAIYSSLGLSALLFQFAKKKIKLMHWYWWFVIALIPIALDGFSQLPGISAGWPEWLPRRESTPFLRLLTGTLFGGVTGWYMLPLMEDSLKETRFTLLRQREVIIAVLKNHEK